MPSALCQKLLHIKELQNGKNLLGFSGGVDSSALFFLLRELDIYVDIAIVNYQTRKESHAEELYALELAKSHGIRCFIKHIKLETSNFEHNAREVRYRFFDDLAKSHGYTNLVLAHQLNDRLEWLLMRLSQGSALGTLLGFESLEVRGTINVVRPLSNIIKSELYGYLHEHKLTYFEDSSNENPKYLRNRFRPLACAILDEWAGGILRSFDLLFSEKMRLYSDAHRRIDELFYFRASDFGAHDLYLIDLSLKKLGYVMSSAQREELIKCGFSTVLGGRFAIDSTDKVIFVAPFLKITLDKKLREKLRKARIPPKVRGYCASNGIWKIDSLSC